jgi:Ser/Thr protein kinase RdoA (MazF antagonist)
MHDVHGLLHALGFTAARAPVELHGGKDNLTWRVAVPGHADAIVQLMRSPKSDRDLAFLRAAAAWLTEHPALGVARNHPAFPGDRFTRVDGGVAQVMQVLPGRSLHADHLTPALLVAASKHLQRFHAVTAAFPAANWTGANPHRGRLPALLIDATASVARLGDPAAHAALAGLRQRADKLRFDPAAVPHGLIHGDPAFKNFIAVGDRVTGLIDYDMLSVHARLWDLADLLRSTLKLAWVDDALWAAMVDGWPLTAAERAALPDAVRAMTLDTGARYLLALDPLSGHYANHGDALAGAQRCLRDHDRVADLLAPPRRAPQPPRDLAAISP